MRILFKVTKYLFSFLFFFFHINKHRFFKYIHLSGYYRIIYFLNDCVE